MRPWTISPGLWPTAPFTDPLVQPLTRTGAGPLWSLSSASPRQLLLLSTQFWHISILQAHSELSPAPDSSSFAIQNVHKAMLGSYYFLPCVIIIFEQVHFLWLVYKLLKNIHSSVFPESLLWHQALFQVLGSPQWTRPRYLLLWLLLSKVHDQRETEKVSIIIPETKERLKKVKARWSQSLEKASGSDIWGET